MTPARSRSRTPEHAPRSSRDRRRVIVGGGRIVRDGYSFAEGPNWVDEGALSIGICSYALVDDGEALVYDTHVSVEHARSIREALEREGFGHSRSSSATGTSITLPAPPRS